MAKRLTDRFLKSLRPAPIGKRYDVSDAVVAGLLVRVTERGVKSFMLSARLPGTKWSTRRLIGVYSSEPGAGTTLKQARVTAIAWQQAIREGRNPIAESAEMAAAARRRASNTFSSVAEDFIAEVKRQQQRKAHEVEQDLRREFISRWRDRPITSITADDVREVIKAKVAEGHKAQAHNLLGTIRRLFNWAVGEGSKYGLEHSPCDKLQKPKKLIGERAVRDRVLSDEELRAFWRATAAIGYPYGVLCRLLLVTGQRESEIAEAVRGELDLTSRPTPMIRNGRRESRELGLVLTIPKERMKGRKELKRSHLVPLSDTAVSLFQSLPRFIGGPHLFSTTFGVKPVNGFAKAKLRLDGLMLEELRLMAAERGEDPQGVKLEPWVFHDLRRTARSAFSMLRVPYLWAEHVIAHAKKGLDRNYDQWEYLDEKREALDAWSAHLRLIVESSPGTEAQHTSSGSIR